MLILSESIIFAQSRSEIELLCEKSLIAANNDDFNTAKKNYDLALSLIQENPSLLSSIPPNLSDYIILTLAKHNREDAHTYVTTLLALQKGYTDFYLTERYRQKVGQVTPDLKLLFDKAAQSAHLATIGYGDFSHAQNCFIDAIEMIDHNHTYDQIWHVPEDLTRKIITQMGKSDKTQAYNLMNKIYVIRKKSLDNMYEVIDFTRNKDYHYALALSIFNIGEILTMAGMFDYAEAYYTKARVIINDEGLISPECATILLLIGVDYRNHREDSVTYLRCHLEALNIIMEIKGELYDVMSDSILTNFLKYYYNQVSYLLYSYDDNNIEWGYYADRYEESKYLICAFSEMFPKVINSYSETALENILKTFRSGGHYFDAIFKDHFSLSLLNLKHNRVTECVDHAIAMIEQTEDMDMQMWMTQYVASQLRGAGLYNISIDLYENLMHTPYINTRSDLLERLILLCAGASYDFGDYDKCWNYCDKIVKCIENNIQPFFHNPLNYSSILTIIAGLYRRNNEIDKALEYFQIAENIVSNNHDCYNERELSSFYNDFAVVCIHSNDYMRAYPKAKHAINIMNDYAIKNGEEPNNPQSLYYPVSAYHTLSEILIAKEEYDEARQILEDCLIYLKVYDNDSRLISHVYGSLAYLSQLLSINTDVISSSEKRYQFALNRFLIDSFSLTSENRSSLWYESSLPYMLEDYCGLSLKYDMVGLGYDVALSQKGFLLNYSNMIKDNVFKSTDSELILAYEEYKYAERNKMPELNELEREMMRKYSMHSEFYNNYSYLSWKDVQEKLGNNDLAIEFTSFYKNDSKLYAALLLKNGWDSPKLIELCDEIELKNIMAGGASLYKESAAAYSCVWEKLEPYFKKGENIFFAPHGLIHQLNIEVLCGEDGKPINKQCNLYRLSSTRNLVDKRESLKYTSATLYGGLNYDTDTTSMLVINRNYVTTSSNQRDRLLDESVGTRARWEYSPGTAVEVKKVGDILNENDVTTIAYTGMIGTEESFKALSGNSTPIIHIATHGFYLEDKSAIKVGMFELDYTDKVQTISPLKRSGLMFSGGQHAWLGREIPEGIDDGILTANEIAGMNLTGTDLLVLSACQTGLGEITGEGVEGLQRGFKIAGVNTIIMSLWEVSDLTTETMMTTFYKYLTNGKSKREAFDLAVNNVRKKTIKMEKSGELRKLHPQDPHLWIAEGHWAAFIMLD